MSNPSRALGRVLNPWAEWLVIDISRHPSRDGVLSLAQTVGTTPSRRPIVAAPFGFDRVAVEEPTAAKGTSTTREPGDELAVSAVNSHELVPAGHDEVSKVESRRDHTAHE